jgi:hypothetical protein
VRGVREQRDRIGHEAEDDLRNDVSAVEGYADGECAAEVGGRVVVALMVIVIVVIVVIVVIMIVTAVIVIAVMVPGMAVVGMGHGGFCHAA